MANYMIFLALAGTLVCMSACESIEDRVNYAFSMLHEGCQNKVRKNCAGSVSTMRSTSERYSVCQNHINRQSLVSCMSRSNCSNAEIHAFRNHICDFREVDELNKKVQELTHDCKPVFRRCMGLDATIRERYDNEDFCTVFGKELDFHGCFHNDRLCKREHDRDVYARMEAEACGASAGLISSVFLTILCCLFSKIRL